MNKTFLALVIALCIRLRRLYRQLFIFCRAVSFSSFNIVIPICDGTITMSGVITDVCKSFFSIIFLIIFYLLQFLVRSVTVVLLSLFLPWVFLCLISIFSEKHVKHKFHFPILLHKQHDKYFCQNHK